MGGLPIFRSASPAPLEILYSRTSHVEHLLMTLDDTLRHINPCLVFGVAKFTICGLSAREVLPIAN